MEKQLIVVVHGVGVREAGGATAQLSAALMEKSDFEAPWKPHSTDDFLLHEDKESEEKKQMTPFPAHMRRFRRYDAKNEREVVQERLVADFYWGDISSTGNGFVRVIVGLFKIVLGLSHAIRENAYEVFPGETRLAVNMRRIARTAPLMIHGPIAAISIVLVFGLALVLAVHGANGYAATAGRSEAAPICVQVILGLAFVWFGWTVLKNSNVYLQRHLAVWLMIIGAVVVIAALGQWMFPPTMQWIYLSIDRAFFGTECLYRPGCAYVDHGFVVLGAVLMGLMVPFWAVVIACAVIVQGATCAKAWFPKRSKVTPIVTPAIALMTVLWLVLMMAMWSIILLVYKFISALFTFHLPLGLSENLVVGYLQFASPALLALCVLGFFGLCLNWRKNRAVGKLDGEGYLKDRDRLAEGHRLIVGRILLFILIAALILMVGIVLYSIFDCEFTFTENCNSIQDFNRKTVPFQLLVVGTAVVMIGVVGQREVASAVAIVTDVLVYLNDYSWRSEEMARGGAERNQTTAKNTRTITERVCKLREKAPEHRQGYWLRGRIQSRMRVLVDRLIADERPRHLVIVSHSQGTVIALEAIAEHGANWLKAMAPGATLKLVTMGSPYTHIYNTYFPTVFADLDGRTDLAKRTAAQPEKGEAVLDDWVNIFRSNDFVGTHIDTLRNSGKANSGRGWPREMTVGPRGHSNYWTDADVFPHLRKVVALAEVAVKPPSNRKARPAATG